ncbi:MAG: hypothetical protein KDA24_08850 [Deltaproteobacteria bacterium]|nr:hypothetical protein [Deltaproteobacteria bacterium]
MRSQFVPAVSAVAVVLFLASFLAPSTSSAKAPNPLGGAYVFVGGGAGAQFGADLRAAPTATFRWGPSLELGGDLGPLTTAVGVDLRVPVGTFVSNPFDLDIVGGVGLLTPTPLVRLYVRLRGGLGLRFTKGAKATTSVIVAPDLGLRFRLPGTKAAFQIGIAAGPRIVPVNLTASAIDVELRLGMKFP